MDFKFLHAADIHLDSPLRGLSRYGAVPAELVRTATRGALDNLVALAIEEDVAFLIIAGDLYDGDWEAFATGLFFCSAMARLQEAGIEVFVVYGNHDAESHLTKQLPLPLNVRVFSAAKPETFQHEKTGARLHGQSYKTRDPGPEFAAGYPAASPGGFNIGLLHTALNGDRGHAPYAACHPDQLAAKGYDYWALGHVHKFDVVRRDPPMVFPGNLQGRHAREVGPKGAALVTVTDNRVASIDHVALDVVRWATADVDLTDADLESEVHERIRLTLDALVTEQSGGRPLMARVTLGGETPLHDLLARDENSWREATRAIAEALTQQVWLEKVIFNTTAPQEAAEVSDEFDDLLQGLIESGGLEDLVREDLRELISRLPAELDGESELVAALRQGAINSALEAALPAVRSLLKRGEHA
ncbi:MAG: DNA repair exonuclease [Alphaproteobacteria bacterium]|nr:DNA repair exonuclease [Alphaproteobacteria bacterium]MBU2349929.1 DNA repair exonuclease [Alphaproteobacteria bacterium]MBU2381570.1 DNA repair exonuclease [Alphaproteobacteria bacterium]